MLEQVQLYISRQASSPLRYFYEQSVLCGFSWIPTVVGIGVRALVYRAILRMSGSAAIESGVRIRFASYISLGAGSYLDQGAYLHACRNGISVGARTFVMHDAILHVYNFRDLPRAGIWIGEDSLIGERCILRGQGGVHIGDRTYLAPGVQVLAVNHVFDDPTKPMIEQGLTAEGIVIEDDVWIGAGAIVLDGVRIGRGAVVAAGAVVTADVVPYSLVAGTPARLVRRIGEAKTRNKLEALPL